MARGKSKKRATKRLIGSALNERIIQLLTETPGLKTSDLAEQLGVDQLQVRNELMLLEQHQEVSRVGQTRGTRWYIGNTLPIEVDGATASDTPPTNRADIGPTTIAAAGTRKPQETSGQNIADDVADARRGPKERVLDTHRALLGQIPDADVAQKTGVSVRTIAGYRKKYGIPGYSGPRRRGADRSDERLPEPATTASGEAAVRNTRIESRPTTTGAWKIEIRQRGETLVRYAFAGDLVEAARAASEAQQATRRRRDRKDE